MIRQYELVERVKSYEPVFAGMPHVDCPPDFMQEDAPRVFPANDGAVRAPPSQAEASPDQAPEGRKAADTVLVHLADCTEGVGLGLNRLGLGSGSGSGLAIAPRAWASA